MLKSDWKNAEITLSGFNDTQGGQDLYVHVLADTYEKADAAVALIELLLTPVSGSSAVASTNPSPAVRASKESTSVSMTPPMNIVSQGISRPVMPAPAQFHPFPAPWFQTAQRPPSDFMPMPLRFPPSHVGPRNPPPYFGQTPLGSPRSLTNRPPMLVMQQPPVTHPNRPMPGQQPPPAYSVMRPVHNPNAPSFPASQPMPLRAPASGNSTGCHNVSAPPKPNNVGQMAPPSIAPKPQQAFPVNMPGRPPAPNLARPTTFTLRPSTASLSFSSAPSGPPLSVPMRPPPPFMTQTSMPAQSLAPVTASLPVPLLLVSPVSGPANAIPPVTPLPAPKLVRPSSGDFTFQPLNTQVPASPSPPASAPAVQSTSQVQPVAPQVPSFRPAVQSSPPMGTQVWPTVSAPAPVRPPPPVGSSFSFNSINIQLPFPSSTPSFSPASNFSDQSVFSPVSRVGRPLFPPRPIFHSLIRITCLDRAVLRRCFRIMRSVLWVVGRHRRLGNKL